MQISVSNIFWAVLGIGLIAYFVFVRDPGIEQERKPNVLIIMIDTLRADHLGVYGYERNTSPFIDSLFRKGVMFKHAYAPSYLTFQTDAAVLSGLYPSQNNVRTWTTPVRSDAPLLQEVFKLYGYDTHAFLWVSLRPYFGLTRGFDTYKNYREIKNLSVSEPDVRATIASSTDPFFIYWTIYDLHTPRHAPLKEYFNEPYDGPFAPNKVASWSRQSTSTVAVSTGVDKYQYVRKNEKDTQYVRAVYDTGIRQVDQKLENFFAWLRERGVLDNTIIIISAQHGEDLGEHGYFFHRDVYENGIRVPLAIIYPKRLVPHTVVTPVTLLDITPTATSLAGLEPFSYGPGSDLSKFPVPNRVIYSERQPFKEFSVIEWPYKYIVRDPTLGMEGVSGEEVNDFLRILRQNDEVRTDELFNIESDPDETKNLLGAGLEVEGVLRHRASEYRQRMLDAQMQQHKTREVTGEEIHFSYP